MNEDTVAFSGWVSRGSTVAPATIRVEGVSTFLALVADGLGGHACGDLASRIVADHLMDVAASLLDEASLLAAVHDANIRVFDAMANHPERAGMGATVAGVLLLADRTIVFNVGDSRVYRIDGGYLGLLSTDDNPPRMPGQPTNAPTSTITQCLGGHSDRRTIDPHLYVVDAGDEDRLLLCTDGVSDVISDDEIGTIVESRKHGSVVALLDEVSHREGRDDASVVLIDCGERSQRLDPGVLG